MSKWAGKTSDSGWSFLFSLILPPPSGPRAQHCLPSGAPSLAREICGDLTGAPWRGCPRTCPARVAQAPPSHCVQADAWLSLRVSWLSLAGGRLFIQARASPLGVARCICSRPSHSGAFSLCTRMPGLRRKPALKAWLRPADQLAQHRVLQRQEQRGPWGASPGPKEAPCPVRTRPGVRGEAEPRPRRLGPLSNSASDSCPTSEVASR